MQDNWRLSDKVRLTAGVRYDLDTFIHPTVSPRVALLYSVRPEHTLRGAISVAYRPPPLSLRRTKERQRPCRCQAPLHLPRRATPFIGSFYT
jgi:iron complex outermembrane receptor protein